MRRLTTTLALALFLLGCSSRIGTNPESAAASATPAGDAVELLTGLDACYAGGQSPSYAGVLIPDPEYGTRIDGKGPVMWPSGYTGLRLADGHVQVLDVSGHVVATTGREYAISPAPHPGGEAGQLMDRIGAIAAPTCYSWDFVDCTAAIEAAGDPAVEARGCRLPPFFDLAAAMAKFEDECKHPSVLEEATCEQIDIAGMTGFGLILNVPLTMPDRDGGRAPVICEQIASAHDAFDGEPLGYNLVVIRGHNNDWLEQCDVAG